MYKKNLSFFFFSFFFVNLFSQQFGTTIITHGYQALGNAPTQNGNWVYQMGQAILKKAGKGCICVYEKPNGSFKRINGNCNTGEVILLFDWAKESNNLNRGYSEAAGDALFSALILNLNRGNFNLNNLHFIGHSRGTVVNTEVVERLLVLKRDYSDYHNIISIDQVTNIDAHDWGVGGIVSDYNNHPNINIPCPQNHQYNNGVIAWKGSGFNDTYFQMGNQTLDGRPVDGTLNCDWSNIAQGHSEIHRIYEASIRDFRTGTSTPCGASGYRFSRIGGDTRPIQDNICDKIMLKYSPEFDFYRPMKFQISKNRIRGIMNGSFDRGSGNDIPGWEEHGGRTGAAIVPGGFVRFSSSSGKFLKHNRFYIPKDAKKIEFKLKIERPSSSNLLEVYINTERVHTEKLNSVSNEFRNKNFDISKFQGQVVTLEFKVNSSGSFFSSQFAIDDVRLSKKDNKVSTLFLFDLSGSMNGNGTNSNKSKLQQAKDASKQTLNSLKNNNPRVESEVGVLGFSGGCSSDPTRVISDFETDLSLVETRIEAMGAGGGTPLAEAIAASKCKLANHLANTSQDKGKLIILSDGQATCQAIRPNGVYNSGQLGQQIVTVNANQCGGNKYQSSKIKYYTIGFNIAPGSPAERDLQYLAQISGGKYLNVQNQVQLERAFKKFNRVYLPKPSPALSDIPFSSTSIFNQGLQVIEQEEFPKALVKYKAYNKLHENDCHGAFNLALMFEANEYYLSAIKYYKKYLRLCSGVSDESVILKHIENLQIEYNTYLEFNRKMIQSDLAYLDFHFKKIQNGESIALAIEFIGFIKEKWLYYEQLPETLEIKSKIFKINSKEVFRGLKNCVETIKRNPKKWDRDATPVLSRTYINMERLLKSF